MDRIQSQIISLEKEKYAIPQENLTELVRIPAKEIKNRLDKVGNTTVIRLRDDFLPLLELARILDVEKAYGKNDGEIRQGDQRSTSSALKVAVVHADEYKYGIVVDIFCDPEQITILPPGRYLSQAGIYKGGAILKDDKAALVLDIPGIAHSLDLPALNADVDDAVPLDKSQKDTDTDILSLLTFRNGKKEHFAVDLSFVERLERVKEKNLECVNNKTVMKYRNGILPVFAPYNLLNCGDPGSADIWEVIVLKYGDYRAGLKVRPPVDAVEGLMTLDTSKFNTPPAAGTIIIDNKSTLLLDVPEVFKIIQGDSVS